MASPLVSIICPVFNSAGSLRETINSLVNQTYSNTEIIVIDGGSTDDISSLVESYGEAISHFISEPDEGMYDALTKGFQLTTGDIVCYINAGDFLNPYAFSVAVEIFENPNVTWITGYRSICNEQSVITRVELPFRYQSSLFRAGSYGNSLPYLQQETTIWKRELLDSVDFEYLRKLKLAGDYYLWWSFAEVANLDVVACPFGVFKTHKGQLSENRSAYLDEIAQFSLPRKPWHFVQELLELFLWALHPKARAVFSNHVYCFDNDSAKWVQKFS